MQLHVHSRTQPASPDLVEGVRRRLEKALRRSSRRVGRAIVRLTDVNGPRGGVDSRCTVQLYLDGTATVVHVESLAETPFKALAGATERCRRAIERMSEKSKTRRRRARSA